MKNFLIFLIFFKTVFFFLLLVEEIYSSTSSNLPLFSLRSPVNVSLSPTSQLFGPDIRKTATPPLPGGVDIAYIVDPSSFSSSSSFTSTFTFKALLHFVAKVLKEAVFLVVVFVVKRRGFDGNAVFFASALSSF